MVWLNGTDGVGRAAQAEDSSCRLLRMGTEGHGDTPERWPSGV